MTSAPDGDVERALAAMGATPLKYYSFGVVAVRPPGSEHKIPLMSAATTNGLPPSGEGTIEQYRAHAVSTVFPLLGLALPEALHIDVEPVWPVGPPVSDQGILLDRNGNIASSFAGLSHPAFTTEPLPTTSTYPKAYSAIGDGAPDTPATSIPFVMPAWLDPTRYGEFAATPASAPSASPADLLAWLDTQASAQRPIVPSEPPNTRPDHVLSDAPAPLGTLSQHPEAYEAPPSFSPFGQAGYSADHRPSAQASMPPSVQMSPHWLDTIKHAETPESEVKDTDWSVQAREERLHQHPSSIEQTTPDPQTLTDHQAALPPVVHPVQPEQLYAAAVPVELGVGSLEVPPLAEPVVATWHEPPSEGPSEPAQAPSHAALETDDSPPEAATMSFSAIPNASAPAGADTGQWGYQWSPSSTSNVSPALATPQASGVSPAPSPVLSTDPSPHLSTDASPNLSTDASPHLSTDPSPHLPAEAPPTSRRNGNHPLADMFRTLGGGGANPMK